MIQPFAQKTLYSAFIHFYSAQNILHLVSLPTSCGKKNIIALITLCGANELFRSVLKSVIFFFIY